MTAIGVTMTRVAAMLAAAALRAAPGPSASPAFMSWPNPRPIGKPDSGESYYLRTARLAGSVQTAIARL